MSTIPGVRVTGSIVPTDTADIYSTHDSLYGRGGLRTVTNATARDAIPADRRTHGMLVYVVADAQYYTLEADLVTWTAFAGGGASSSGSGCEYFENTAANIGTNVVDSFATGVGEAVVWHYVVVKGTDVRSGTIHASWDGSGSVEISDISTPDVGDTSDVSLTVVESGGNIELRAVVTGSNGWSVKGIRIVIAAATCAGGSSWFDINAPVLGNILVFNGTHFSESGVLDGGNF